MSSRRLLVRGHRSPEFALRVMNVLARQGLDYDSLSVERRASDFHMEVIVPSVSADQAAMTAEIVNAIPIVADVSFQPYPAGCTHEH